MIVKISVLIPCYNEETTIADVICDFKHYLPDATIYVYDNASTDRTAEVATAAGALVRHEALPGKGNVVRRMFADIESDVYVLVDGDNTYDAQSAPSLIDLLLKKRLDMLAVARNPVGEGAYRTGHKFGNVMFSALTRAIFGKRFRDMLTGYRIFSRRFVKSFPALSAGFEIETEITIHALELGVPIAEVEAQYKERPEGSKSKLRTYRDGMLILYTIVVLIKEERPFLFFGAVFLMLAMSSIFLAFPLFDEYVRTGLVPRLPTAILATGMMLLAFLSLVSGLILDTVTRGRREFKRLQYLQIDGLSPDTGISNLRHKISRNKILR
jgi:glycosyltransferase involved in cell wall biosynthesis